MKMKKNFKSLSLLLAFLMVFSVFTPAMASAAEDNSSVTVTILGTSDMHGRIYPWEYATASEKANNGFAKIQTLIKEEKAKNPNTILIDNGDTTQDNMAELFNDKATHPMVDALNYMGYDTWTLGNHEFNFGMDFLNKNMKSFKGKVLGANIYKEDGTRFANPYTIIEKGGIRIAVVGIIPPHIPTWEAATPEHFKGLTFTDPVAEAKKAVKELQGKYDVLIGAMHLGDTAEYGTTDGALAIAEACPEFDAILCGHKHAKFDNIVSNSGVKLIEPGKYGEALAKIDVKVAKENGKWVVKSVDTKNLDTTAAIPDADMLSTFKYVDDQSKAEADKVVGYVSSNFIDRVDYITGSDKITTMPTAQLEDNAVIDLINEVQAYYAGSEISSAAFFKNDANLKAGFFRKRDVANIYMYDNTLMGVNITGKNLKAYMEWSANYYNQFKPGDLTVSFNGDVRGYNYDMFSGMKYQVDISKPVGKRIVNATINGQPIDDNKTYKMAVNNYRFGTLLTNKWVTAADKYYDSAEKMGDAGRIRDLIIKYVQENKGGRLTPSIDENWKLIGYSFDPQYKAIADAKMKAGEITIPTSFDGRTLNVRAVTKYDLIKQGFVPGKKVISLVSVNDFHGSLAGEGKNPGIARLASFINSEKKANPKGTLVLSAGDMFQGSADSNLVYGDSVLAAMNYIGFDAMSIGNHEFDWGLDKLRALESKAKFPFMAANIKEKTTGKTADYAKDYVIIDKDGINVGIIGLATPETLTKTKAENVAAYNFADASETVKALIPEVKKAGADIIIVLSHLGAAQDSKTGEVTGEAAELAKNISGVEAIVAGHTHLTVAGTVNNIPIVEAYYNGRSAARVDLVVDTESKKVVEKNYYVDAKVISAPEDAKIKAWFTDSMSAIAPIKNQILGKATADFPHNAKDVQVSVLGQWVTDVMRAKAKADIAIQNGGGIRRDIPAGNITMGVMYELMPFDNTLFTFELTGKQVKQAIEHGIMSATFVPGQFSGVKVKYDSSKPEGQRIIQITTLDGKALDDNKLYKVVTNDFQAGGGDGYVMFKEGKNQVDTSIPVREVLVDEIKAKGSITPVDDGRMIDVHSKTSFDWYQLPNAA
jgi:2',3'-cyclic-nucleotide 2'-phosphodiesterase/3'-nucleotidase/5'-nucleotidase